jgi:tetratricopeptide (TPR) repeat protein
MEYAEAYALFEEGDYDASTELLKGVADLDPRKLDPEGRDNRDLAVYILGQIEHAGGRIASAIDYYKQVLEKFADAAEAVQFFTRKSVSLPETKTFRTGEEVKVELKYRNVPEVTLSVYKVDLMKLLLMRKSLVNVTDINLAGISPMVVEKIKLGEGKDYKDMTREISLPLEDKGAYMAVVQGEAAGCTGMILVTDLNLDVQEETASGRVRVNVKDRESGAFVKNVYVKVIGSDQNRFLSGYTDLRGVFIADGIAGTSTVIAEREGEYAFHRGRAPLMMAPQQEGAKQELQKEKSFKGRDRALQNVFRQNRAMQQRGVQQLDEMYQQNFQNVQIK